MLNKNLFRKTAKFTRCTSREVNLSIGDSTSSFTYKIFSHESFNKAVCKQTYWDNLTQADKQQHYNHGAYNGITMNGREFLRLIGKCHIILSTKDIIPNNLTTSTEQSSTKKIGFFQNLTVGSMVENSTHGIEFKPVTGLIVNKGDMIHYMSILNDSKITIEGNYLTRTYKADMLIVDKIWECDDDYVNNSHIQWVLDDITKC
jgi:hypothetical protein